MLGDQLLGKVVIDVGELHAVRLRVACRGARRPQVARCARAACAR
jgi:hypothetical protein